MSRIESLGLFEIEFYKKTRDLTDVYNRSDQNPYKNKGRSCAIMMRGELTHDEKTIAQYEIYINRFINVSIRHGIKQFIITLRNAYDVLCAEIIQKYALRGEAVQLICIDLGGKHNNTLPQNIRSRLWKVLDRVDYAETVAFAEDATGAEEQALLLADTLLFIYNEENKESTWNHFLFKIVNEAMSPNCYYDLRKIWLISLSDICDN
ncbi:MAG: hypothetical protein Q4G52_06930 [Clostridia bacterium]|nr:hypothetical protein [Clostridia bacterium]